MQPSFATLSHEIRNPLTGLLSVLHVLRRSTLDARQQELLDTASEASHTLLSVLDNFLLHADFHENLLPATSQTFLLRDTAQTLLDLFSCQAQDKGILLLAQICPTLPACLAGDVGKIQQILSNLLANALRFTDNGIVKLQIDSEKQSDNSTAICFHVIDSGIGITTQALLRIMAPAQAMEYTPRRGGTGLGLRISRQLAHAIGGSLHAHSEEGRGSIFTLRLPWQAANAPACVELPLRRAARIS